MSDFSIGDKVRVAVKGQPLTEGTVVDHVGLTYLVRPGDRQAAHWYHQDCITATGRNADAEGLSEELNNLRNDLGRVITRLDHIAAGAPIMSNTIDAEGASLPFTPQPTLATVSASAVAIGKSIVHYAELYT